ncbi:MAG: M3 family metallopeptidase [Myxococcaceae bacterium]|nr:M3 family metallopeptidase [Myxococcaceae bacterium]
MPNTSTNVLLAPWKGPHGGVPPLDQVKVEDFAPALEQGMAETLAEMEAIATSKSAPTFENTLVAMEKAGQPFNRAVTLFFTWSSSKSSEAFRAVEADFAPKLAGFNDLIVQNAALFARIKAVNEGPEKAKLSPEQQRLLWHTYNSFVKQGAALDDGKKKQLSELNQKLASLTTKFAQNQMGDEETDALVIDDPAGLKGLPEEQVSAAAAEAERRGLAGKWVIANTRSSMEPFLTSADDRGLREKGFRIWSSRGDNGNARDNNATVTEILSLRAKKAKLLGYETYAHWKLSDQMAKTPDTALKLMQSVWRPAVEAFKRDVAEAQALAARSGATYALEAWDFRYWAEKLRKAKYDLDLNEVKPYLQLERLREAMFFAAGKLYGLTFTKVDGLPVFDPQQTVYEVKGAGGEHVGLWYFDPYARPGKQSGAWMGAYREQQNVEKPVSTLVSNNSNFIQGANGEPVTVSWDDARTMFHEFGHALHGLLSKVTYPSLSGTNTTRDFVEFPSQFNEHYLSTPEVLKFLTNAKGDPIPPSLLERIEKARTFNQGFQVAEAQASAIVDMKLHLMGERPVEPKAFEKSALAELGMPRELVMRHRIPAFGHVFSGDGYAAGYYSYVWAEVLEADAYEAFLEAGGPYDAAVAKRLKDTVLSVGNTVDPADAFRAFRGRDPKPDALLRSKGFPLG